MLTKSPAAVKNYAVDWSLRYPGDSVASSVVTATGGLVVSENAPSGLLAQFTLTNGAPGAIGVVTVLSTFASGQTDVWFVNIRVLNQ